MYGEDDGLDAAFEDQISGPDMGDDMSEYDGDQGSIFPEDDEQDGLYTDTQENDEHDPEDDIDEDPSIYDEPHVDPVQADAEVLKSAGFGTDEDYDYAGE